MMRRHSQVVRRLGRLVLEGRGLALGALVGALGVLVAGCPGVVRPLYGVRSVVGATQQEVQAEKDGAGITTAGDAAAQTH